MQATYRAVGFNFPNPFTSLFGPSYPAALKLPASTVANNFPIIHRPILVPCRNRVHHVSFNKKLGLKVLAIRVMATSPGFLNGPIGSGNANKPGPEPVARMIQVTLCPALAHSYAMSAPDLPAPKTQMCFGESDRIPLSANFLIWMIRPVYPSFWKSGMLGIDVMPEATKSFFPRI
jgi:hypothetical protein